MEHLRELEVVRAAPASTIRAVRDEGDERPLMEVRFSNFGNWYEIDSMWEGEFMERVQRGAFAKTMVENREQVKVLFNHGYDPQIGDKVLGPIADLREDKDAALGVVPLFDTSYNRDLIPGLEAGVYGSSMRFRVIKDEWNDEPGVSEHNPKGIPERTITEARLYEFGPVTFPANPESTSAMRSMTDQYYERMRSRDPHAVEVLERSVRAERTPPERPSEGAASTATDEPGSTHSGGMTPAQRRRRIHNLKEE